LEHLRKSVTDSLKSVGELLSLPNNHARIQVFNGSTASEWGNLQGAQASLHTHSEDMESEEKCASHGEYQMHVALSIEIFFCWQPYYWCLVIVSG